MTRDAATESGHDRRKVLITGASGGIGLATARRFARNGDALFLHGFSHDAPLRRLRDEFPGVPMTWTLRDLGQDREIDRLIETAWEWERPGVEALVQTAGVDVLTEPQKSRTFEEKLDALWQIDVRAGMRIARELAARMHAADGGVIVNVGWNATRWGMAGDSAELFAAAKGAITAFSRALAQRWSPSVRVHCVAPGWIRTSWGELAPEAWQQRACRESLTGRWGTPADVANAVHFLASQDAEFLDGVWLPVDGGRRM